MDAVGNGNENGCGHGLLIRCAAAAPGVPAEVSTPTFIDFSQLAKNFSTIASPTLYSGQLVKAAVRNFVDCPIRFTPYILYYDVDNHVVRADAEAHTLKMGLNEVAWEIPDTGGMPVFRLGFSVSSDTRFSGSVLISSVDWKGAPRRFAQSGMLMKSIWDTTPYWTQTWASSARHFAADFKYTYCVSHPGENGVVTTGTRDWDDYAVSSSLCFSLHKAGGLTARARGHRRYYAAVLTEHGRAVILRRRDGEVEELACAAFSYRQDVLYTLEFRVKGERLELFVDGQKLLEARDDMYQSGGAGFLIDRGTMTADGFSVCAL